MSGPPDARKFVHREGEPCFCDVCQPIEPLYPGQIFVRVYCRETTDVRIDADELFVECKCCHVAHSVNRVKEIDRKNGHPVYEATKAGWFSIRCHGKIKSLTDENRQLKELKKAFDDVFQKKEFYKAEALNFWSGTEMVTKELEDFKAEYIRYATEKTEELKYMDEKVAHLEEEFEKTTALLENTENALEASKAELRVVQNERMREIATLNETTEALDRKTKEVEECKKATEDIVKELTAKSEELEQMKAEKEAEENGKSPGDFLALRLAVEELKREREEEQRRKARIEQLEAEIADRHTSIHRVLQATVKKEGGERISRKTTFSRAMAEMSRKRRASELSGRNPAGDQDVVDTRDLSSEATDSSHSEDPTESSCGAAPSSRAKHPNLVALQERWLKVLESQVKKQRAVKKEIVDGQEGFEDSEARVTPTPRPVPLVWTGLNGVVKRDPRMAKRARMN